ncbi:MAG TPA: ATP-binding cassette domain-containing protein, partial [Solirubrobacteraceae bacterium]
MSTQYVYTMHRLSKAYPPDKQVLKDVTLAFLPGAKIGVLGYNGAGKSTVLRIMAGTDHDYTGEARLAPGASVGM